MRKKSKGMSHAAAIEAGCKYVVVRWTSLERRDREYASFVPKQCAYEPTSSISLSARFFTGAGASAAREMCPQSSMTMPWSVMHLDELLAATDEQQKVDAPDYEADADEDHSPQPEWDRSLTSRFS